MIHINLLPWRQQARLAKKRRLITAATVFSIVTLCVIFIFHLYFSHRVGIAQQLTDYLQSQINEEQISLNNMGNEETERNTIETKLLFIKNLVGKNVHTVRLFNDLVELVPGNISITQIIRNENLINLAGLANNEEDITLFMQALSKSPDFKQATLTLINQDKTSGSRYFELSVEQKDNSLP